MAAAANILIALVALLHVYFLVLEMFLWDTPFGRRTFRLTPEYAASSKALAANQGLYNGFLAAGLLWGLALGPAGEPIKIFFLACVICAGVFGAFTVSRRIFWIQAFPAIIALALLLGAFRTASAAAPDVPRRKSGLWEIAITGEGSRQIKVQECIDQQNDDLTSPEELGAEERSCSRNEVKRQGAGFVAESVCKIEGSTARTRAVFTGSFDSAYKVDVKASYQPPLHGVRESTAKIEGKWLGPCKAGQKPGDIVIPGMPGMDERTKGAPKKR